MTDPFIVDAIRTAVGRRGGGFANEQPADIAAHVINGGTTEIIKEITGRDIAAAG